MSIDIDSAIFIVFLVINLIAGLYFSKGTKTIREYAVGNRNFSTATIAATIVATWVSGETFFSYLSDSYTHGLYAIWAYIVGEVSYFLIIGYFFAPRLAECLGALSIAEVMGDLYGKYVRIITAITGAIGVIGLIAIQLKISGLLFEYCFGVPSTYGVFIGGFIVTIYSAIGGIKSVTLTDVIQLFTFGTIIPVVAYFISSTLGDIDAVTQTLTTNPLFDYNQVFDFTQTKSLYYLSIPFIIAASGFGPPMFQRMAMAKDVSQISRSFIIAAFCCLFLGVMMSWVGILIISTAPDIEGGEVTKHVLFNYSTVGLKGLMLVGIMAMVMSTADSYINSVSILFVHDFCKPLGIKVGDELLLARWSSLIIGVCSIMFTLRSGNLMQLLIAANMFYMPIVTIPFVMAMLGFRSTTKSVLIGMGVGFITVIIWENFFKAQAAGIDAILPAMAANLIGLMGAHYLLKQPGGWVGIRNESALTALRQKRREKLRKLIISIVTFSFISALRNDSPRVDSMYLYLGLFCIISIFSTMHAIPNEVQIQYSELINFIYPSVFFMATILVSYPLWPSNWKKKSIMAVLWNLSIFYILICVGSLLVIMSNFAHLQLMTFMMNLIVIAVLVKWQWALVMISIGILVTIEFFKFYLGVDYLPESFTSTRFEATYLLVSVSSILIIFLKPKQEYQDLTEEQNNHLQVMIKDREVELGKAQELKHEFLRNLEHEVNAPLVGLTSLAPMVLEDFDRLSPKQMKKYVKTIVDSHERYKTLSDSLLDLSKLDSLKYKLSKVKLNLSELIESRMYYCRKLYLGNKELEFVMDVTSDVIIECDEHYITSLIDNLIINSIKYSKEGKITLKLHRKDDSQIEFQIIDEGIGIPKAELHDIFGAFVVSSKTRTPSGGRGIGLALCKKVAEVHGGSIRAESDGERGAAFILELPVAGV